MKLFDLFGRRQKEQPPQREHEEDKELQIYSGMRVEVTAPDGRLLFVAQLRNLRENGAELYLYSESALPPDSEPLPACIRGYNDHNRKAVYMEGVISPMPQNIWKVEELAVRRVGNDRAFFRLETNLDATATMFSGLSMGERPCKLLNISVGGACITSETPYHEGDKFLLKVKLLADRPESVIYSEVMRIIHKGRDKVEYGCRFLELTEEDETKITQNIFTVQRQQRSRY